MFLNMNNFVNIVNHIANLKLIDSNKVVFIIFMFVLKDGNLNKIF